MFLVSHTCVVINLYIRTFLNLRTSGSKALAIQFTLLNEKDVSSDYFITVFGTYITKSYASLEMDSSVLVIMFWRCQRLLDFRGRIQFAYKM